MTNESDKRQKALEMAMAKIDKDYGAGTAMILGDQKNMKVEAFSTGSLAVDIALGVGGLPKGRIIEVYGPESSGKTTMTLHAIASAQKLGGTAVFIDAEHALDPVYAANLGVDVDKLVISQPTSGEDALNIANTFTDSGAVDLIVIDSVAALVPKAELNGEIGDASVGVQARMMSQALRRLSGPASQTKTTVIFINQLREKIGVMFGSPETTTGGKALKFYASVRVDIRRIAALKEGEDTVGNRTRVKIVKNKVAPPFKQAETDILYGTGFSREGDIIDLGVHHGIIRKAGAWYSYDDGVQLGQGKEKTRQFLIDNPKLADELESRIRTVLKIDGAEEDEADSKASEG